MINELERAFEESNTQDGGTSFHEVSRSLSSTNFPHLCHCLAVKRSIFINGKQILRT